MFDKERVEKIAEAWVNFNRLAIDAIERDPLTGGLDEVDDIIQRDPGEGWKFIEAVRRMDVDRCAPTFQSCCRTFGGLPGCPRRNRDREG